MIAAIPSASLLGVDGRRVLVEVHVSNGLPGFTIVGLPDAACREARDRVRAALLSSAMTWPLRRVTVNLAPSGLRKVGAGLDLPIAIGLLVAVGELKPVHVSSVGFLGELGLDGTLRSVPGVLPLVAAMTCETVVVPPSGVAEALLVGERNVLSASTLADVVAALKCTSRWPDIRRFAGSRPGDGPTLPGVDLAQVRGQAVGRRAVEVAAAGRHHLLMSGPPGSGKTMLAERLAGILPPLGNEEVLETCKVYSAAGLRLPRHVLGGTPPFRAPHHSASAVALLGGGSGWLRPGEVSLASNGVLFLDELAEFPVAVLESLRQPLEEGVVRIARARAAVSLPAKFLLVAAMNPCPCGEAGSSQGCKCGSAQLDRYLRRLSAPLLDRFDLHVAVSRPKTNDLFAPAGGECSSAVAARVVAAREMSRLRGFPANSAIPGHLLDRHAPLDGRALALLRRRVDSAELSARGLDRVRRVARTIADLDGCEGPVKADAVATALELRAGRRALLSSAGFVA